MNTLSGDWHMTIEFIRGQARHALHLEQEGDALKGRCRGFYANYPVRGRVSGEVVELWIDVVYEAVGATYSFRGTGTGKHLSGSVDLGEYGQASWEAEKLV